MKKILLLMTLLILVVACGETVDDSQWKSDMEARIKTLESKKDMPMMGMMHNEDMEEMMGMEERHRDVEELKIRVTALEKHVDQLNLALSKK